MTLDNEKQYTQWNKYNKRIAVTTKIDKKISRTTLYKVVLNEWMFFI